MALVVVPVTGYVLLVFWQAESFLHFGDNESTSSSDYWVAFDSQRFSGEYGGGEIARGWMLQVTRVMKKEPVIDNLLIRVDLSGSSTRDVLLTFNVGEPSLRVADNDPPYYAKVAAGSRCEVALPDNSSMPCQSTKVGMDGLTRLLGVRAVLVDWDNSSTLNVGDWILVYQRADGHEFLPNLPLRVRLDILPYDVADGKLEPF